jgi:hypothetical protein
MPDATLAPSAPDGLAPALARAAGAIARLDQALAGHPLQPAFLYRARLEAVRRQAAADGQAIDPWHLAAVLEGLRLRMEGAPRLVDRGAILAAARHALALHGWLAEPDADQEGAVRRAERVLADPGATPLLAAANGLHAWLGAGGARPSVRAALVRHWTRHRLLRAPVPLTGAAALRAEVSWRPDAWRVAFLDALADEAEAALRLLLDLESAWLAARRAVAGRRRTSRAPAAVDLLATAPLLSATTLARGLGMAVKNAAALLDAFRTAGIAVEVTHRAARRLYGLAGLAPLRDAVAPPRRPVAGRNRGRPAQEAPSPKQPPTLPPGPPLSPLERRDFDYGGLEQAMAFADDTIRRARRSLDALSGGGSTSASGEGL